MITTTELADERKTHILLVYSTHEGQTAKIMQRIKECVERLNVGVEIANVRDVKSSLLYDGYDGVIVGAPLRYQRFPKLVRRFVKQHVEWLNIPRTVEIVLGIEGLVVVGGWFTHRSGLAMNRFG